MIFEQHIKIDLSNSAYHKTDRDPRLSRPNNIEKQQYSFPCYDEETRGLARPSRFAVRIELPTNLERNT